MAHIRIWTIGKVLEDGRGGYGVIRRGFAPGQWFTAGLATKGEAYKVLYALGQQWKTVQVRMRNGTVIRLSLTEGIPSAYSYGSCDWPAR